jgi:putative ABC transport system permease protein
MGTLLQDLRFAFRQLRKAPSFAVTAVLTLALGIGANTAIFSLVNSLLIKPLPVPNPNQLATLALRQSNGPLLPGFSWPEFKEIRAHSQGSFSQVFAHALGLDGFAVEGQQPQRILTSYVSGNFFEGLGLKPAAGRLLLPSEGEVLGRDTVVVLGYDFWKERFNGDRNVVGRQATINGHPFTIVGVAPKGFSGVQAFVKASAYMPLSALTVEGTPVDQLNSWQSRGFSVYGRLLPGVSFKQASSGLSVVAQGMTRQQPEIEKQIDISALPERTLRIATGDPNTMFVMAALFLSLAGMVLLLACVNVANLVLVRATVREREMAIRSALGAQRSRLIRQMVTESVALALVGGVMGVLLGMSASTALSHIDPHADLPVNLSFQFDWRIFLYSFAIALLAGIVVGVVPALRVAKANVSAVLHEGGRGITGGRHWLRDGLVVMQIAGSLVLLVVAGLFVRSLSAMQTMDFGFKPNHVLNFAIDANEIGMNDAQTRDLAGNILARLHQISGVDSVSHAGTTPMGYFSNGGDTMLIDGTQAPTDTSGFGAGYNIVSPEYFSVMGIDFLRGRSFTDADDTHGRDVAVISESTAKKYWPNQDPMGRTFRMQSQKDRKLEIVGIVRDAEFQLFGGGKTRPFFFIPYAQHVAGNSLMVFQLRTERDPLVLVPTVEKAIHELAPQLPIFQVQTMRQALYTLNGLLLFQIGASLAAIMGGLGLTLAVIGLYGVVSYAVSRRVHEIGLRMALGASRGTVFRMIYRQSFLIVASGLGIGLAVALLAARAVGSFVVVSVWDPRTYVAVASVLAFAAFASCYLPARRAMEVEPMVALRQD